VFAYGFDDEGRPRGVVLVAPRGLDAAATGGATSEEEHLAAVPATESDELGAFSSRTLSLFDHSKNVRDWAEDFANRAGLTSSVNRDVTLAGYLHDLGKADPRYQTYFAGGDPYGPDSHQVLAKSGERRLPADAWQRAGLPPHWRHEALSVRLAPMLRDFARACDPMLVLWLVGSHHGYGRPLFPHCDAMDGETRRGLLTTFGASDDLEGGLGPQSLGFSFDGRDWVQIFEELKARYGIWGLARLEALLRLADHRASETLAAPGAETGE
jgi:CRISPR-associated endonuclease/helicase Cas3